MANDLREYIRSNPSQGFKQRPYISREGDFLSFFLRDEDHYAQRVDGMLTVYLSMRSGRVVGVKIKGIKRIFETVKKLEYAWRVTEGDGQMIQLSILIMPGMALASDPEQQEYYEEVEEATRDVQFDASELEECVC